MATKRLTAAEVEAAKPVPGKRLEVWDERCSGLCLRVTERGVKTWGFRYRSADGRTQRLTLGAWPDVSLADARDRADAARKAVRAGSDPVREKRAAAVAARSERLRTMDDLATAYFAASEEGYRAGRRRKRKADSTLTGERWLWSKHISPRLGRERLEDVDKPLIRGVLRGIHASGPIQSNRALALIRVMFNFAIAEDRLTANPAAAVEPLADEKARDRVLTDEELQTLWAGLDDPSKLEIVDGGKTRKVTVGPVVCIAIKLAALTLQRRSNIAGMRVADLRLDEGVWIIPGEVMKGGAAHMVPLTPTAVNLIKLAMTLRPGESSYVFPSPRDLAKPISAGALSHAVGDILQGLKIEGATLHDLRRTGATAMASERLRVPPHVISLVLSHSAGRSSGAAAVTMAHYVVHQWGPEKRAALEGWERLLLEIVGRESDFERGNEE